MSEVFQLPPLELVTQFCVSLLVWETSNSKKCNGVLPFAAFDSFGKDIGYLLSGFSVLENVVRIFEELCQRTKVDFVCAAYVAQLCAVATLNHLHCSLVVFTNF